MPAAMLAMLFMFATPDSWASPEASGALRAFEGEWGLVSVEPADDYWGAAIAHAHADGAGACGAGKALNLDIREESLEDGTRFLMLRKHPNAESGTVLTTLDVTDDNRAQLTAELLDEEEVYERNGDVLTLIWRGTRLTYERCNLTETS